MLTPDGKTVAGFYTLSQYSLDLVTLPDEIVKKLPKYPEVPATLVGRLAISERFRGQGFGLRVVEMRAGYRNDGVFMTRGDAPLAERTV